jgi:hypothetical protein
MRKCDNVVVGEKLTCCESYVRGCVVIMGQPIARAPQFRSFSPNVLPQMAKNIPYDTLPIAAMSLMVIRRSS